MTIGHVDHFKSVRRPDNWSAANMPPDFYTFDEWTATQLGISLTALRQRLSDSVSVSLSFDQHLRALHAKIRRHIAEGRAWGGYDYGLGYLYQSCPVLGLSGRRKTDDRVAAMSLVARTRRRNVLDIGCNAGFVSLALAPTTAQVTGFDFNPHLIAIAQECSRYLKLRNTKFVVSSFSEFSEDQKFDVVMSLSNHITFDGPIYPTIDGYLKKCARLLAKDGQIVFESHTPEFEVRAGGVDDLISKLRENFVEVFQARSAAGPRLNRGRPLLRWPPPIGAGLFLIRLPE